MKKKKAAALFAFSLLLFSTAPAVFPEAAHAAEIIGRGADSDFSQAESRKEWLMDDVTQLLPDPEAPAAQRGFGYTEAEARQAAESLYCFETNELKKEIDISYLMSSIWYQPENLMLDDKGRHILTLYKGSPENYLRSCLEAIDGLEFFSAPILRFLHAPDKSLLVGLETGERFSEQRAAENYQTLGDMLALIEEIKQKTAGMGDRDKARLICDYVAERLSYDESLTKNCLGDALRSGETACVGYNALTELLFEHCGMPYISLMALRKDDGMPHILGTAKVDGQWPVFDTTNYDQDGSSLNFLWIFSDLTWEGMFYKNFALLEEAERKAELMQ